MANFEKTCSKIKNFFATTIKKNKKTQLRKTLYGLIYCLLQVKNRCLICGTSQKWLSPINLKLQRKRKKKPFKLMSLIVSYLNHCKQGILWTWTFTLIEYP